MPHRVIEVPWERLRPGVTVARSDGNLVRIVAVEPHDGTVTVLFRDGLREQHDPHAPARIVVRRPGRPGDTEIATDTATDTAIDDLVGAFLRARDPRQIEWGADRLGASGDPRVICPLLGRLGDATTLDDPDVEDAVCGALVALGVMEQRGNLDFALCPADVLPAAAREALAASPVGVPGRYRRP